MPFGKMLAMPIIFTCLSLETVYNNFTIDAFVVLTYLGALVVGLLVGMAYAKMIGLEADSQKWLLKFEGGWSTMILVMSIFVVKGFFGYEIDADPQLLNNTTFEFWMLSVSSFVTGMFIGRAVYYYMRIKKGPSVELNEG